MDFETIVKTRYATKKFDGKSIPAEQVEKLLEIVRLAPSSFNIQPWQIYVISDQALKEKLRPAAWNQEQVTSCSHLLIFCATRNIEDKINALEATMIAQGANKETIAGYVTMMHDFAAKLSPAQKLSWAQRQVYLPLGNALNGAKALGFDSCPMEGFDPQKVAEVLGLGEDVVPTCLCALGYASDTSQPKVRFDIKDVFLRR